MRASNPVRLIGCRSALELLRADVDIEIAGGPGGTLKADRAVDVDRRAELIKAARAGEHIELTIRARTYRQKDGQPNKRFLRIAPRALKSFAPTFAGKPFLLDHDMWTQRARMGTILSSELVDDGDGWRSLVQAIQVVKPEAVISVLDGTIDGFSISWGAGSGDVLCTAHRVDVRDRAARQQVGCSCWPGDRVLVDGQERVVEWEYTTPEGRETSGVNAPASSGTRIEDIRAALSAELGLEAPSQRAPSRALHDRELDAALANVAEQLGLDVDDVRQQAAALDVTGAKFDGGPGHPQRSRAGKICFRTRPPGEFDALANIARQLKLDVNELRETARELGLGPDAGDLRR